MYAKLPNLEIIDKVVKDFITTDEKHGRRLANIIQSRLKCYDLVYEMFPQMWGSTCTGFDVMPDGGAVFAGDEMTEEYTVVAHERITDTYLVFFGSQLAYEITEPTDAFYEDLKNKNLASISEAKLKY